MAVVNKLVRKPSLRGENTLNETTRREFLKDAALAGAAITTTPFADRSLFAAAVPAQTQAAAGSAARAVMR